MGGSDYQIKKEIRGMAKIGMRNEMQKLKILRTYGFVVVPELMEVVVAVVVPQFEPLVMSYMNYMAADR